MIIVDTALRKRLDQGNPVRLGVVGCGHMAKPMIRRIIERMPGLDVVAVSNRTAEKARAVLAECGRDPKFVSDATQADRLLREGATVYSDDPAVVCRAEAVECVVEVTGDIDFSVGVALDAFAHGKHFVGQNAELDCFLGPLLQHKAKQAGVVYTNGDGDQPGCTINLMRWVRQIGFKPLLLGNCKGLLDHYRTPDTQAAFAKQYDMTATMATNFADGTKLASEMASIANAAGVGVLTRGMRGPACDHVDNASQKFDLDELIAAGGCVDYLLGANPGPGVFVLGYDTDPENRFYMDYFKLGKGPLYSFYIPYHLPHLETPLSAARAVLFQDPTVTPLDGPTVEVITVAKRDLKEGQVLDGIGGFDTYGLLENIGPARQEMLLPVGLASGAVLTRDIAKDQALCYSDVELPADRPVIALRQEQDRIWGSLVDKH